MMKTLHLTIFGTVMIFAGMVVAVVGIVIFFDIHANEVRLESMIKAGSSVPFISYDDAWMYMKTSVLFFGIGGFLLIWRKRK